MCECHIIEDSQLIEPVSMVSKTMKWIYRDKDGKSTVLIESFNMDIEANRATVSEERNVDGDIIGYVLRITK